MIKLIDDLTVVTASVAVTTTASTTGVNIVGLGFGEETYACNFNVSSITGTADASNYHALQLEVSDTLGGTYYPVGNPVRPLAIGNYNIAFSAEQISAQIASPAYFRVTATKTGTTATGITYGAYLTLDS